MQAVTRKEALELYGDMVLGCNFVDICGWVSGGLGGKSTIAVAVGERQHQREQEDARVAGGGAGDASNLIFLESLIAPDVNSHWMRLPVCISINI
jgi:hypothetical protein